MKRSLIIILGILLIFLTVGVENSDASYYDLKMNVGEYTSDISNQLYLEEQGELGAYNFKTELKVSKDYRFLSGKSYAEDWEVYDYLLRVSNDETELEVGETDGDSTSYFLTADSLLGLSLQHQDYNLWYGEKDEQDLNFGSQGSGLQRLGFSYDGDKRKFGYQYQEDLVEDRHYFSYEESYKTKNLDLTTDTAVVTNEEDSGAAVKMDLSTWYQGISWRGSAYYYAPEWQEIENQIFASGEYDLSLQAYKKLNTRYMLESEVNYSRDNLDNSQSFTSREWDFNNTLSYFSPNYNTYQLGLDYQVNNYGADRIDLNLNSSFDNLEIDLNYQQQRNQHIYLEMDYSQRNYNYYFKYRMNETEEDWNYDAEVEADYNVELSNNLESNSIINLSYLYGDYRLNLTQGLDYRLSPQQTVEGKLSLNHYFDSDSLSQKFIFNYRYQF